MLRDEEALRDLVGPEVLVQEEQYLDLAGRQGTSDRVRDASEPAVFAHAIEQSPGHAAGERRIAAHDSTQKDGDLLRGLRLQEVARCTGANRCEKVFLRVRCREDDHFSRGRRLTDAREGRKPVHPGHRQVEEHEVGLQPVRGGDRLLTARRFPDDFEPLLHEERGERASRQRVVVDDQDPLGHAPLIGSPRSADKGKVDHSRSQSYRSWLLGELLLVGLLASATALFSVVESLQPAYVLPDARLAFDTAVAVAAAIVSVLASVRFLVEGRTLDLLLAGGFWSIALGTVAFGLVPVLDGGSLPPEAAWALVGARLLGAALIALAPYTDGRLGARRRSLLLVGAAVATLLASAGMGLRTPDWSDSAGSPELIEGSSVVLAAALLASLWLVALIGFALRYRRHGRDLDSWMCFAATLALFADLHLMLTPVLSSDYVLQGDFLRLVAYGILLVGVWRAIAEAEFGRAIADERARVAREIHDGLAQYLFAISTQVNMLESGAPVEEVLPRLKRASTAAQQEARFAVLALSSAGGTARFDAALRRYVDVLTADGALAVELDVDPCVRLAPDEQIEVFRIVQEGLGNARRHAGAGHVEVSISERGGRRVVSVRDDGVGFEHEDSGPGGQGLENMRVRAEAIEGRLSLRSAPGRGTAIEVVLRPT